MEWGLRGMHIILKAAPTYGLLLELGKDLTV